jgi:hypothetical protein
MDAGGGGAGSVTGGYGRNSIPWACGAGPASFTGLIWPVQGLSSARKFGG